MIRIVHIAMFFALTGCVSAPPPYVPPKTPCEAALRILASPYATLDRLCSRWKPLETTAARVSPRFSAFRWCHEAD